MIFDSGTGRRRFELPGLFILVLLSAHTAAATEFIQCRSGGARDGWKFDCTSWGGCEFSAKPQSDKRADPTFFKDGTQEVAFRVALGAKPTPNTPSGTGPSIAYGFPEWTQVGHFDYTKFIGTIDIDGKIVYAETSPKPYLSTAEIKVQGPNQPIIDAMRNGKMLTANVLAKTGELMIAMTYPLKGFADAVDAGKAAEADIDAKLQAGAQCIKEYDYFWGP